MFYFTSIQPLLNFYFTSKFVLEQGVDNGARGWHDILRQAKRQSRAPCLGTKYSHLGNKTFPPWE